MKKILLFLFLLISAASFAQVRLAGTTGGWTTVDANTYTATFTRQTDLTGNSFTCNDIETGFRVVSGTASNGIETALKMYTVTAIANSTSSTIDLTVDEVGATQGAPSGLVFIYDPDGRMTIPQVPVGSTGATAALQAAIDTYNSRYTYSVTFTNGAPSGAPAANTPEIAQDTSSAGGNTLYRWDGDSWETIGSTDVAVAPTGPYRGLIAIDPDSIGLDINGLSAPPNIAAADKLPAHDASSGGNVGILWSTIVDQIQDSIVTLRITQASHGRSIGQLVNIQSVTGVTQLADADFDSLFAMGIVISVPTANTLIVQTSGIVGISGVVAGQQYYTSATAGAVTTTAPAKIQVAYQGIATNVARLVFDRFSSGSGGGGSSTATGITLDPDLTFQSGEATTVQEALEYQKADLENHVGSYKTNSQSYTSQSSNISNGDIWGEWGKYVNSTDHFPDSLVVNSVATANITARYYRFASNLSVTQVDSDVFSVVSGRNAFKIDTTGKSLSTSRLYVALETSVTGGFRYQVASGDSLGYNVVAGSAVTYPFSLSYHLVYRPTVALQEKAERLRVWSGVGSDTMSWKDLKDVITNYDIINLPAQTIWVRYKISIPSNRKIIGVKGKTILKSAASNSIIFEIDDKSDVSIQGITFQGRQSSAYNIASSSILADSAAIRARTNQGSQHGLVVKSSYNIYLADLYFLNFNGSGLRHQTNEATRQYVCEIQANGIWFYNCYIGFWLEEGEYSNFNTLNANNCLIGAYVEGGNNTLVNVNMSNNRVGMVISEFSGNSAHGSIIGGSINHNNLYGLYLVDVATSQNFIGIQHWSNGSSVWVKKCKGVKFTGCHFSNNLTIEGGFTTAITGCSFATDVKPTLSGTGAVALSGNTTLLSTQLNVNNQPAIQLSGSGSPSGSVTPNFTGQDYFDTSGNIWWKSKGTANTDWIQLN